MEGSLNEAKENTATEVPSDASSPPVADDPVLASERMPGVTGGLVAVAAAVIIFWGVQSLSFILGPMLLAMIITIAVLPLPGWFIKKGMKPAFALVLTILTVVAVLALIFLIVMGSLGKLAGLLPTYTADMTTQVFPLDISPRAEATPTPGPSTEVTATLSLESIQTYVEQNLPALSSLLTPQQVSGLTTTVIIAAGKFIAQGLIVLFIFGFMLSTALALRGRTIAGYSTDNPNVKSFQEFTAEVRQYVNLLTVINLLVAIGDTILLWLLDIPFPLLWGFLAFLMGYIPAVGWWISLIPPFFIAWAEYGVGTALIVLVAYIFINGGVQNIIQPRMMGRGLRMSPLVVFVSVIVWTTVLGGLGALIAVPLTLIVIKLLESTADTRWIAALLRIGTEGETAESKEAVQQVKGLASNLRRRIPFAPGDQPKEKVPDAAAGDGVERG
jgi:predicted PurR-regulated permease PerM